MRPFLSVQRTRQIPERIERSLDPTWCVEENVQGPGRFAEDWTFLALIAYEW